VVACGLPVVDGADALMLRRMTLSEQVHEAGDIVHGVVAEVATSPDESGILATWVTVDVARTLKGPARQRLTFKQLGGTGTPVAGSLLHVADLPSYRTGEEVVLLLRRPSRRGFTSPVGLADGIFRVEHAASGARVRDPQADAATTDVDALLRAIEAEMGRQP
jgi:hypothetical protein